MPDYGQQTISIPGPVVTLDIARRQLIQTLGGRPGVLLQTCSKCGIVQTDENSTRRTRNRKRFSCYCRRCVAQYAQEWRTKNPEKSRENDLRSAPKKIARKYGIDPGDIEGMRQKQNNQCAICKAGFDKKFYIDHCHLTGKVRGLLCNCCNIGLGHLEKPGFIHAASEYLKKASS